MKTLLRSTFTSRPEDDPDLTLENQFALLDSGLGFEQVEDTAIWTFVTDFARQHHHAPAFTSVREHFARQGEMEVVDRLEHLSTTQPRYRGNFLQRLNERAEDRRIRVMKEILTEAGRIVKDGITVKEGREDKILKGPYHAIQYVMQRSHDIVTPTTGQRLYGNVPKDGQDFLSRYQRVKDDPKSGIGFFTGISQMDDALSGAKRAELWTHAAFTGGLKCVAGDTHIFDVGTGCLRTVKEIHDSGDAPVLHALDERVWGITHAQASPVVESGVREILKVSSDAGRSIRVSDNHPFMTPGGWVDAGDLKPGSWVAVPDELPYTPDESPFLDEEVALLGYMLGDGTFADQIGFTSSNTEILNDFVLRLEILGYQEGIAGAYSTQPMFKVYSQHGTSNIKVSRSSGDRFHPWVSALRTLADRLGLYGCRSADKFIPAEMWGISEEQVWLFLSALWSTDGRVGIDRSTPGRKPKADLWYGTRSQKLATDLQLLLQRVGVSSTVSMGMPSYKGTRSPFWTVLLTSNDGKRRFLENTAIIGKQEAQEEALSCLPEKSNTDWMPPSLLSGVPDSVRAKTRQGGWHYSRWAKKKTKLARDTMLRLAEASGDLSLIKKARGRVRWERIVAVEPDGFEMTYDLEVPGPANFVANGFITHNSTLALNWAYNQAVFYRNSVLFLSLEMPYEQVRNILYAIHSGHPKFKKIHPPLPYNGIRDGHLTEDQEEFLRNFVVQDFNGVYVCSDPDMPEFNGRHPCYGALHIEVSDPDKSDYTVDDLKARAELLYQQEPFHMIFVDHAGLMAPRKWVSSTTERLNEVLRNLKRLSMNFRRGMGIAVVTLFQISREGFKSAEKLRKASGSNYVYNLTHLSYANEAERSSDIVTAGWVDEDLEKSSEVLIMNLKSRDNAKFEPFRAKVEFGHRRVLTLVDGGMDNSMEVGEAIDASILDGIGT